MHSALVVILSASLLAVTSAAPQFSPQQFSQHFASPSQQFAPAPAAHQFPSAIAAKPVVPLISRSEVQDDAGQFSLSYVTGDGITVQEQGLLKPNQEGTDHVLVKQGSYSYTSPEGQQVQVQYTADENGFQPQSPSIPVQGAAPSPVFV